MARSDDPTVYTQTWREDEQGQFDPYQVDPAQPPVYNLDPNATQAPQPGEYPQYEAGYAPDDQGAYQQGNMAPQPGHVEQAYDPYAASYDQHLAAPQTQPAAAPVAYAADPADFAAQHYAQPQAQGHPAAPVGYDTQPEAPTAYDHQPITQSADPYATQHAQPNSFDAGAPANYGSPAPQTYEQPTQQPAPAAQYAGTAYGDYNPHAHAHPAPVQDAYAPLQYESAAAGQVYADTGNTYSDFGQPQQPAHAGQPQQGAPAYGSHDPYAFPQDNTLSHDPQTGPAYLDPSAFGQQQAHEPQFGGGGQQQYSDFGAAPVQTGQPGAYEQGYQDQNPAYFDQGDQGHLDPAIAAAAMEPSRSRRGLIVVGALVAAVGIGGALGFAYKYSNESNIASSGNPPTIKASKAPSKVAPKDAGGKTFANQQKKVYTKLATNRAAEPGTTRLVPREEGVSLRASTNGQAADGGTRITSLQNGERTNVPGVRRVRTLRVNPDGTFAAPKTVGGVRPVSSDGSVNIPGISMGGIPTVEDAQVALIPKPKKVVATLPKTIAVPKPRVAKTARKRVASLGSAVPTTRPSISNGGGIGFVVQVAARRSRIDALAAFADLQQRYSRSLSAKQPDIQEVSIPNRGKWYRVRIGPPGSKNAAYNLCGSLKKSGLKDCIVKVY